MNEEEERKVVSRGVAIGLGVLSTILLIGLIVSAFYYSGIIERLQTHLSQLEAEKENLQAELSHLQTRYETLQLNYSSLQSAYHNLQLEYERMHEQRYREGYLQGVIDGAGRGFTIRDPTYHEALQFIAQDETDKNPYIPGVYVCLNFAADVKNNAFKAGYRCGFVYIEFPESAHAIICFNTTDHELIFIEPQDDRIVTVDIGIQYWRDNGYEPPSYNDTITNYIIIW
ncbi:hypothetical protein DRJ17_07240 [Candidatus Woesearchaeota archaeon]|nr:MAG: hypothetical protein DRJ17_07240 [Candidatus Woesearchaeota archaeon]